MRQLDLAATAADLEGKDSVAIHAALRKLVAEVVDIAADRAADVVNAMSHSTKEDVYAISDEIMALEPLLLTGVAAPQAPSTDSILNYFAAPHPTKLTA